MEYSIEASKSSLLSGMVLDGSLISRRPECAVKQPKLKNSCCNEGIASSGPSKGFYRETVYSFEMEISSKTSYFFPSSL